jgi:hypothetical protein
MSRGKFEWTSIITISLYCLRQARCRALMPYLLETRMLMPFSASSFIKKPWPKKQLIQNAFRPVLCSLIWISSEGFLSISCSISTLPFAAATNRGYMLHSCNDTYLKFRSITFVPPKSKKDDEFACCMWLITSYCNEVLKNLRFAFMIRLVLFINFSFS